MTRAELIERLNDLSLRMISGKPGGLVYRPLSETEINSLGKLLPAIIKELEK